MSGATVTSIAAHPRFSREREPLVTKRELAHHYAVSERSIERWQQNGLPFHRLWSRRKDGRGPIRYRISEVGSWLDAWLKGDNNDGR